MTDLPANLHSVPGRLGATGLVDERGLVIEIEPRDELLHHGVLRASVISFAVDVVAGVTLDTDPDAWTFTTDLTLRMRPVPAPGKITASGTILRQGRRSAHGLLEVVDERGAEVATGAIGFAHVPRKPTDPPKPIVSPDDVAARFSTATGSPGRCARRREIVSIDPVGGRRRDGRAAGGVQPGRHDPGGHGRPRRRGRHRGPARVGGTAGGGDRPRHPLPRAGDRRARAVALPRLR